MCSLSVFTLDKDEDLADRYGVLLTLLLAAVAFQYIINSELPKLPYLTLLDIYVLFSFAFVFFVIVCVFLGWTFEVDQEVDMEVLNKTKVEILEKVETKKEKVVIVLEKVASLIVRQT